MFFEYADVSVIDVTIQSLNSMELSNNTVQHASVGAKPGMSNLPYDQFPEIPHPIMSAGKSNTSDALILLMPNMVTPKDLVDNQEYSNIYKDVKEECSQYGAIEDLHIPWLVKKDKTKCAAGETGFQSVMHSAQMKPLVSGRCMSSL